MKALSIKQPWAWLIVNGVKDVENRSWPTRFRGVFAVHAGKVFDDKGYRWVKDFYQGLPRLSEFEFGGIVGMAEVVDCVRSLESRWFFGPYGFVLRNARPMAFVPMRGQLGFFPVLL